MNKLKELRLEIGISQKELANKLVIDRRTYCNYEIEKSEPNIETLIKLADFFQISIDYLVGRADELDRVIIQTDITADEKQMIQLYRKLIQPMQARLIGYTYALLEQQNI